MKKILSKLLVFALVVTLSGAVSLFAGCSGDDNSVTDYEHTIVFYSSQGDSLVSVTDAAIASFEAKYPGWKVEHIQPGGYDDVKEKVVADFKSYAQPDLAYCYPDHVALYLQTKKVVALDKFINSTEKASWNVTDSEGNVTKYTSDYTIGYTAEELADFVQTYWKEGLASNFAEYTKYGYSENDMLTLPFVRSTDLMYYNKTALDACGLTVATTWDELWAQCATLQKKFEGVTPLGVDSEANWFIEMCEQNAWGYTSIDENNHYLWQTEAHENWLSQLNEYYQKGYITTKIDLNNAYTSTIFTKGQNDGGLVYCIGSSGGASHQDPGDLFDWGITSIPGSTRSDGSVNYSVISQGPSLVMLTGGNKVTNSSEKEVMTFMFIKELLNPEFQAAFSMASGYNTVRLSTDQIEEYKTFLNKGDTIATAVKVGEGLRNNYFVSPAFKGSSTARTAVGNALYAAMTGQKTPTEALADAYRSCNN